jgi:hypothetical protein
VDAQYVAMGVPIYKNGGKLPLLKFEGQSAKSNV